MPNKQGTMQGLSFEYKKRTFDNYLHKDNKIWDPMKHYHI